MALAGAATSGRTTPARGRPTEVSSGSRTRSVSLGRGRTAPVGGSGGSGGRWRAGVVRPLVAAPASAKPYAVSPTSFNEAQDVADKFLAGTPVIVNLQEVDAELRRRLVDFSSGLCYGLRGQMERVTNGLYLLTPSNVEVSAEERRRLHERA